jgi:hypothetical protein
MREDVDAEQQPENAEEAKQPEEVEKVNPTRNGCGY